VILHLVNDLPLMGKSADSAEAEGMVSAAVERLAAHAPAEIFYLSYSVMTAWWQTVTETAEGDVVLVGTRPAALYRRLPTALSLARVRRAHPHRFFDARGRTTGASMRSIAGGVPGPLASDCGASIIDDVLMTGHTLTCVVKGAREAGLTPARAQVMVSNRRSAERFAVNCPEVLIDALITTDYEPIMQGTVIFLFDLLYGQLLGRPFREQTELLCPYFGTRRYPLREFCGILASLGAPEVRAGGVRA
jgi:hypothetical protein